MREGRHRAMERPWLVIALSLAVVLLLGAGAGRLSFDPRYSTFFDASDPQLQAFEHLRAVFAPSDTLLFVIDPGPDGAFDEAGLALLEALTDGAWQLPFTLRVDSPLNYPHSSADGDLIEIAPLVESAAELDAAARAEVERIARSAPELAGRLVDARGRHVAVAVTVLTEGDPLQASDRLMAAARALATEMESRYPAAEIHLGGIVGMNHAFSESSMRDSATLLPLMLLLMLAGLAWLLGAVLPVLAITAVMIAAVIAALGAVGWMGMVLTTPTAIAPIIIITVAIADGVHLVLGQRRSTLDSGLDALRASLDHNTRPIVLTTATTAAGFLSMNFSAVPPFRDLGNLVAIGVLLAGTLSLTLLPALLRVLPDSPGRPPLAARWLVALMPVLLRRRLRIAVLTGIALLLILPGLGRLQVNDDFVGYFDAELPFSTAADLTDAHLSGMYEIEYQLSAEGADGIHDPAWLAQVEAFTAWLREQPETGHVLAWTDVIKRLNRTLNDDDPAYHRLPDSAAIASQYTLLYELSLPLGLDLTNAIASDYGSVRQVVALRDVDSREVLDFEARASRWLEENAPAVEERHGGINLMFAHISERNVSAMIEGNLLAVGVIALMLAIALRSLRLALVSLLTNLVPVAAAFALWGWFVEDVGLALSAAFGMTLGIVVDDTVHLLSRYRDARTRGEDSEAAVRAALLGVGPALIVTTVILLAGFACLAASSFALNGLLAQITMLTIALALLFDLLLLPALLARKGASARGG